MTTDLTPPTLVVEDEIATLTCAEDTVPVSADVQQRVHALAKLVRPTLTPILTNLTKPGCLRIGIGTEQS